MPTATSPDVFSVLQIAVAPVILISGIGLLLLSMTNRIGRAIDRARVLAREVRGAAAGERAMIEAEINILYRRARLLRVAILLSSLSILLAGVLIATLFFAALFDVRPAVLLAVLFVAVIAALVGSLAAFLRDVHLSLYALELEIEQRPVGAGDGSAAERDRSP